MNNNNKKVVADFLETIWNQRTLSELDKFVSEEYRDHSFVPGIPPDRDGLRTWIENTSKAFDHATVIETIIEENDHVAVRISFRVKHIGKWRNVEPTGEHVVVKGFRLFRLKDGFITEHWALIDGEALETAIRGSHRGCVIQR